jgi:uncharacterized membrane protein YgcG
MALSIPIVSEFDGKGIEKAVKEFKSLETAGEKANFALQKAAVPAAAAIAGIAAGLGFAAKAAIEDAEAQDQLAGVLKRSALATDEVIASNEEFISTLSRATATADDQLRPALSSLVTATGSLELSQQLLTQSQDIAISTNNELSVVVDAVSKAYNGNMKGLKALDPSLMEVIKSGASFNDVMATLAATTGGAATDAANTAAGKMRGLKISLDEAKESIGAALLPTIEKLLPVIQNMAYWFEANTGLVLKIIGAVGALSATLLLYNGIVKTVTLANAIFNATLAANPIGALTILIGGTIAAMVYLEQKTNALSESWGRFGAVLRLVLGPLYDVVALAGKLGLIDKISLPSLPTYTPPSTSSSTLPPALRYAPPNMSVPSISIPSVTTPSAGGSGGGGGGGSIGGGGGGVGGGGGLVTIQNTTPALTTFGNAERIGARGDTITVNVNGGISTSAQIGQAVYNSLLQYKQVYGPLDAIAS